MNYFGLDENAFRLSVFASVMLLMMILEACFPRVQRVQKRKSRWFTNLSLIIIDSIALRIALPIFAMGVAVIAQEKSWGLLNLIDWPLWLELLIAFIILDMLIYWQHVASHRFSLLWQLHKVHHADRDIDTTTGVRFHPIEIILSMLYKMLCIILLGPSVIAVFIFEVILNACALFNHANLRLPQKVDAFLRWFIITPDVHRVHHSAIEKETNSNYGFCLSIWDRVFKSYIDQPKDGHKQMTIGLSEFQNDSPANLWWAIVIPFKKERK